MSALHLSTLVLTGSSLFLVASIGGLGVGWLTSFLSDLHFVEITCKVLNIERTLFSDLLLRIWAFIQAIANFLSIDTTFVLLWRDIKLLLGRGIQVVLSNWAWFVITIAVLVDHVVL